MKVGCGLVWVTCGGLGTGAAPGSTGLGQLERESEGLEGPGSGPAGEHQTPLPQELRAQVGREVGRGHFAEMGVRGHGDRGSLTPWEQSTSGVQGARSCSRTLLSTALLTLTPDPRWER